MLRIWKQIVLGVVVLAGAFLTMGFSLLGPGGGEGNPAKQWQLPGGNDGWVVGYNLAGDIGGPMDPVEFYRWNVPEITYAFDSTFVTVFGTNGMKAVDQAIRVLNDLPPASRMSEDLSEFPLNTAHLHPEAAQLGLMDLKSAALFSLMEQVGLADAIRWTWSIRHREGLPDNFGLYTIVQYNFDPVTLKPSSYVNGNLWTYFLFEDRVNNIADLLEIPPPGHENIPINYPVASSIGQITAPIISGHYFDGLTRDDVGALRFLLRPRNHAVETLLPGTVPGLSGWNPFLGTNFLGSNVVITNPIGTNNIATAGWRGGVDKIRFRKVFFDPLLGQGFTNQYTDRVILNNGETITQTVRRGAAQPDIVFTAEDTTSVALIGDRTTTAGWLNNDPINGISVIGGPGVISPPIFISFNYKLPFFINNTPFFVTEPSITDTNARVFGLLGPVWASFDGTTNAPIIYPQYLNYTIEDIRNIARGGLP